MSEADTRTAIMNTLHDYADEILQAVMRINILIEQRLNPAITNYNMALEQASQMRVRLLHVIEDDTLRDAWEELELHAVELVKKLPITTSDISAAALLAALSLPGDQP